MAIGDHSPSLNPAMPGYSGQILFAECISKLLKILLKKKKKPCSKQASALITSFKLHSHPARSHYVTEEETGVHKKVQATFPRLRSRRVPEPQAGSLRFRSPAGTRGRTPAHGGGGGAPTPACLPPSSHLRSGRPPLAGRQKPQKGPTRPSRTAAPRRTPLGADAETRTWA